MAGPGRHVPLDRPSGQDVPLDRDVRNRLVFFLAVFPGGLAALREIHTGSQGGECRGSTGPGLLESVYEAALAYDLEKRGLSITRQQAIPVVYEAVRMNARPSRRCIRSNVVRIKDGITRIVNGLKE
jgi:hypothetical protein